MCARICCRKLKDAKEKLWKLQELMMRVQQGAGLDALADLESVTSANESVDESAATAKRLACFAKLQFNARLIFRLFTSSVFGFDAVFSFCRKMDSV